MRIGLQIPSFKVPGGTAAIRPNLEEVVTTVEDAGFYSLWVMDHYYQIKGLFGEKYTDPMMEAYTTLGYLAGLTEKAYLGVLVAGVFYRHPSVLMKTVNTLYTLKGHCERLGRDYGAIEKTSLGTVHLSEDDTVESVLQRLRDLSEMGFTHAIFNMPDVYALSSLETFGKEIVPEAAGF